jgi:hypothetical protein
MRSARGVRLPTPVIEDVITTSANEPRSGWAEAARMARKQDQDRLLDEPTPTEFDQTATDW